MVKKVLAVCAMALLMVPVGGSAFAQDTDKLDCFFYQTFRERDVTDCIVP
jgi:hypothetical protein